MLALLLAICALISIGFGQQSCTQRWQCANVSNDFNYVDCVSGKCQCITTGFIGNATLTNKCRCDLPYSVYWLNSAPYCIRYADAVSYQNEQTKEAYQIAHVSDVYTSLIFPTPVAIIQGLITGQPTIISQYVADNATGRVDPLGKFSGKDGVVEYFYGTAWTGVSRIPSVTFNKIVSQGNVVFVKVFIDFNLYDAQQQNILYSYKLAQSGSFSFNSQGLIQSVDLIIHNLNIISDILTPPGSTQTIQDICNTLFFAAKCNSTYDPLGYYTDYADCINHFTNVYTWGNLQDIYFNGNNTMCRFFHSLLAIARPDVHCSHSGKTGGGKCISHSYESYFTENF